MLTRDVLNKVLWDSDYKDKKDQIHIKYTHRGVPGDFLIISCLKLIKVRSDSFEYFNDFSNEIVRIPFHRIQKIFNHQTNEILYNKRGPGGSISGKKPF